MAAMMKIVDWRERRCRLHHHRPVWQYLSLCLRRRHRRFLRQEGEDGTSD